jgi:sulfate transport system ATP-binding protein
VYQFLGNVNILPAPALVEAGVAPGGPAMASDGHIYVRPHDIEVVPHDSAVEGISAVLRHVHAAGSHARLILEHVQTRETIEAEVSRTELAELGIRVNDLVKLKLRRSHSFNEDYAI